MLIDTHTHLDDARYDGDRDAMIDRARQAGVERFVTIGCDLATSRAAVALADQHQFVYASIGCIPTRANQITKGGKDDFGAWAGNTKAAALEITGPTYHTNHPY